MKIWLVVLLAGTLVVLGCKGSGSSSNSGTSGSSNNSGEGNNGGNQQPPNNPYLGIDGLEVAYSIWLDNENPGKPYIMDYYIDTDIGGNIETYYITVEVNSAKSITSVEGYNEDYNPVDVPAKYHWTAQQLFENTRHIINNESTYLEIDWDYDDSEGYIDFYEYFTDPDDVYFYLEVDSLEFQ